MLTYESFFPDHLLLANFANLYWYTLLIIVYLIVLFLLCDYFISDRRDGSKVMLSKMGPLWVSWMNRLCETEKINYIFKSGDGMYRT